MLDFAQFKDEFITCCRVALHSQANSIHAMGSDIEIREGTVCKPQIGKLTGLCFKRADAEGGPTIYAEDFYKLYKAGMPISKLSSDAVDAVRPYIDNVPVFGDDVLDLSAHPENLRVRMIGRIRNREALKNMPYLDLKCGLVLTADIWQGEYRTVVSNSMIESLGMDKEKLFELALANYSMKDAVLFRLEDILADDDDDDRENLIEAQSGNLMPDNEGLYLLSNKDSFWGAAALFYPGVMERVYGLMGGDFYVLPSSVHELLLLPVSSMDPQKLVDTIRSANRSVMKESEILADDLFICRSDGLDRYSYGGMISVHDKLPC